MIKRVLFFAVSLGGFLVQAQEIIPLKETTVLASKLSQKMEEVGRPTVLVADSILRKYEQLSLGQLLEQETGMQVLGARQSPGSPQSVFINGALAAYTAILIDGVPVGDPSTISGAYDLNFISLSQIERIEIMQGGASTLYGSNAMAGVINIITKTKVHKSLDTEVYGEYGSFNTLATGFNLRVKSNAISSAGSLDFRRTNGFSSAKGGDFEADGMQRIAAHAQIGFPLLQGTFLQSIRFFDYLTDADLAAFADEQDFTVRNKNLQLHSHYEKKLKYGDFNLKYLFNETDRVFLDDSGFVSPVAFSRFSKSTFASRAHFLDTYVNAEFGEILKILIGAEYNHQNSNETFLSKSAFGIFEAPPITSDLSRMNNLSLYTNLYLKAGVKAGFEIGDRVNRHSTYNWNKSFHTSAYYWLNSHFKGRVSANTGFKNPGLYQLFSIYGNQELNPETSRQLDVGLDGWFGNSHFTLNYYVRDIRNLIDFVSTNTEPFGTYENLGREVAQGIIFLGKWQKNKLLIQTNVNYLLGNLIPKEGETIDFLLRRPKWQGDVALAYQIIENLGIRVNGRFVGKRNDAYFNSNTFSTEQVMLNSYSVFDFLLNYNIHKKIKINASIQNILNRSYYEIYGYTAEPRNFSLRLLAKP